MTIKKYEDGPRVALVLGGGGPLGAAWMSGALAALAERTGWEPRDADVIVGTSAGSILGTLSTATVPAPQTAGKTRAQRHEELREWAILLDLEIEESYPPTRLLRPRAPGSPRLALEALRRPSRDSVLKVLAGLMPRGTVSLDEVQDAVRRSVDSEWVGHPNLWVVAVDYETGERTVFGRDAGREARIEEAVSASCAVPGMFAPVEIDGRVYVDGGTHSMSNADLVEGEDVDLVVILNPLSSRADILRPDPMAVVAAGLRRIARRQLDSEVEGLRAAGHQVVVLEPTAGDLRAMGPDFMDSSRRLDVVETSLRTAAEGLSDGSAADLVGVLPASRRQGPKAWSWRRTAARAGAALAA